MNVTLDESYARCRELNKRYGTTYYWSTYALPRVKRHHVWALYAFCRHADDIVDDLGPVDVDVREKALADFGDRFFADLDAGHSDDPVLKAVVHTVRAFDIDPDCFRRFLRSMAMDLTVTAYATWDDLLGYMDGSAAVIGEMMLPILEPLTPDALEPARDLGNAFQLTNFLRDVAEDLDRGRVYLPQEDLDRFGADPARRTADPAWRGVMAFEIDRARALYRSADLGVSMLPPTSARCIRRGAHAVLRDPRSHRGLRLRRLHPPGDRAHVAQGDPRRPDDAASRVTTAAITVVVVGWLAGAVLLWRVRTPRATTVSGLAASVSVVIPARNEEHNLPRLLASLQAQTEPPLEVLVVDDDSVDRTAAVARAAGCVVVESGSPPPGWLGKPWACHQGAAVARGERLLFLDADTWLAPDGVARLAAAHQLAPDGLLSVQPFHAVERPYEQLSAVGNVVSVLASGMAGPAPRPSVAFGPCLLVRADVLAAVGGFETVRGEIVEDAALARAFRAAGRPVTCLGGGATVAFRMYPEGLSALVAGWTRSLAGGAGRVRAWTLIGAVLWVTAGLSVIRRRRHRAHGDGGGGVDRDGDAALVDAAPPRLVPLAHRGPVPHPAARLRGAVRVVLLHASGAAAGDVARAPGRDRFVMLPLLVDLSGWGLLAANVVGAGCVHAGTGYVAHRLPLDRLERDGWLLAARPVERGGRALRASPDPTLEGSPPRGRCALRRRGQQAPAGGRPRAVRRRDPPRGVRPLAGDGVRPGVRPLEPAHGSGPHGHLQRRRQRSVHRHPALQPPTRPARPHPSRSLAESTEVKGKGAPTPSTWPAPTSKPF